MIDSIVSTLDNMGCHLNEIPCYMYKLVANEVSIVISKVVISKVVNCRHSSFFSVPEIVVIFLLLMLIRFRSQDFSNLYVRHNLFLRKSMTLTRTF